MSNFEQLCDYTSVMPLTADPPDEARWYAVQTRARHEKKVAQQLQEKRVTTFLPLIAQMHRWSDRRKLVQLPLFPCYTFVQMGASVGARILVRRTMGVVGFVGVHGEALPIPDKQIEDIRTLLAHTVPCVPYPFLRLGQRVRIRGGCLEGIEGILVGKNSDRSLVVSVELIQRSVAMRIEGYDVEMI